MFSDSAIGQHFLDNPMLAQYYSEKNLLFLFIRLFIYRL